MANTDNITLSDLHKAFRSMANAYDYFGDAFEGIASRVGWDREITLDSTVRDVLLQIINPPKGGGMCQTPPYCSILASEYRNMVQDWSDKSGAMVEALNTLLEQTPMEQINFRSGTLPGPEGIPR
jgi:hypothetical protein